MLANPLQELLREALCDPADDGLALLAEVRKTPGAATASAWSALLADPSLGEAFIAAIQRSGALEGRLDPRRRIIVEDLIAALGRLSTDTSRELLVGVWTANSTSSDLRVAAGDALLNRGDHDCHRALASLLDQEPGPALNLALRGLFTLDPVAAYDQLAPRLDPEGDRAAALLQATLRLLMNDVLDARKPGATSPPLFSRDPRWRGLCAKWSGAPSADVVSRWGDSAQTIHEIALWLLEPSSS